MGPRPAHLNLNNDGKGLPPPPRITNWNMDMPSSPRTGEIPPALSPLDAFALQSRILAKKFDREAQNGRRISRLPYNDVAQEFANRPDFFRSISGGSDVSAMSGVPEVQEETSPTSRGGLQVSQPGDEKERPMSHYPMLGHARTRSDRNSVATPYYDAEEVPNTTVSQDYFGIGIPRSSSPEPADPTLRVAPPSPMVPSLTNSVDSMSSNYQPRTLTGGSTRSQRSLRSDGGLAPPRSPAWPKSPRSIASIRSVRQDSGDEDGSASYGVTSAVTPSARKFSNSSARSRAPSPFSPHRQPVHRSPSATSERSVSGSSQAVRQQRSQLYNFSRPLSSSGQSVDTRPSFESRSFSSETRESHDLPLRHPSASSNSTHPSSFSVNPSRQNSAENVTSSEHTQTPSFPPSDYSGTTPGDVDTPNQGEYFPSSDTAAIPSYTYTKYALPRGRPVERNSIGNRTSWLPQEFSWEEKKPPPPPAKDTTTAASTSQLEGEAKAPFAQPLRTQSPASSERISGNRLRSRELTSSNTPSSITRSHSAQPSAERNPLPTNFSYHRSTVSVQTESASDQTIKATPLHERALSANLTAEEHLDIGIEQHTAGNLTKSTYHLRLAANAGLPTAMLLYALACRHGWGMRANQEEGVSWLRKAIDASNLDEEQDPAAAISSGLDPTEQKRRKAQFALAIYELGISYMNGWGCAKDKPLAVRCYEVAGKWGDCDALAEAGYCYTQGIGCRKDMRRAAGLYRKAAEGGMEMAGVSWIYKPKYMDDAAAPTMKRKSMEKQQKQKRTDTTKSEEQQQASQQQKSGRSRGRTIWGWKKGGRVEAESDAAVKSSKEEGPGWVNLGGRKISHNI